MKIKIEQITETSFTVKLDGCSIGDVAALKNSLVKHGETSEVANNIRQVLVAAMFQNETLKGISGDIR